MVVAPPLRFHVVNVVISQEKSEMPLPRIAQLKEQIAHLFYPSNLTFATSVEIVPAQ